MSFLSSAFAGRRMVLLCARLLVQFAIALSNPQTGMDELNCVGPADSPQSTARECRDFVLLESSEASADVRQIWPRLQPG